MRKVLLIVVLLSVVLTACYPPKTTNESDVLVERQSGEIKEVKFGGGRHWSFTPMKEATIYSLKTHENTWVSREGSVWTTDRQPVTVQITVNYRIKDDDENIRFLIKRYPDFLDKEDNLRDAVFNRLQPVVKSVTPQFTLTDIVLGDGTGETGREQYTQEIMDNLQPKLDEIGVKLESLFVLDIDPSDDEYEDLLNEATKAEARRNAAEKNRAVVEEERKTADVQNQISIDRAEADAEVRRINAKIWEDDRAFELEMTRLIAEAIENGDVIVFVPEDGNLTYFINGNTGNVVPVD